MDALTELSIFSGTGGGYSQHNISSDGELSAMSSGISMPSMFSRQGSEMDILTTPRSGITLLLSTGDPGLDLWMSSLRASRASLSVEQEECSPKTTQETDGRQQSKQFATYDPDTHSWKTFQISLFTLTLEPFSQTYPKQGLMRNGKLYRRAPSVLHTHVKGCSLWPTPTATEATGGSSARMAERALRKERRKSGARITLKVGDLAKLKYGVTKKPILYEWLMGWVPRWTALEPLETDSIQQWLRKHGCDFRESE